MKHDLSFKKTGLCFVCGKSTKLLIHGECGKNADKNNKAKKYSKSNINHMSNIG